MARAASKKTRFPINSTKAAYEAGFLTALQQCQQILVRGARSFGEAIDAYAQIEREVSAKAQESIKADVTGQGANLEGADLRIENTPKGLFIDLVPVQVPQQGQASREGAAPSTPAVKRTPAKKVGATVTPLNRASRRAAAKQ
ncbi:hypothetical protein [Burkholderia sp. Ac-20349]|uniref:hypothetical protein n=1 Tax=Burkholderia sp. Ac-20349 TaxID=2703893 RepID=UPI00197BD5E3|nr:hypothetical protein [Burkholderia sp. Ac-20349]MBN3839249.1 hypothetical protein [Burkholderia sp. Ac-20349]